MRKIVLMFLGLFMAVVSFADDIPPPPFIAPPGSSDTAPPPPLINIEGDSQTAPTPVPPESPSPQPVVAAPAPTEAAAAADASISPAPTEGQGQDGDSSALEKLRQDLAAATPQANTATEAAPAEAAPAFDAPAPEVDPDVAPPAPAPQNDAANAALEKLRQDASGGTPQVSPEAALEPAPMTPTPEQSPAEEASSPAPESQASMGTDLGSPQETAEDTPQTNSEVAANAPLPSLTPTPWEALGHAPEAPPPPMVNVPVESAAPAAPVSGTGMTYEQIGGKGEPPAWFFTPEPGEPPQENASAPEAPQVVVPSDTPTPMPAVAVEAVEPTPQTQDNSGEEVLELGKSPHRDVLGETVEAAMKDAPEANPNDAFSVALLLGRGKELESEARYYEAWRTYEDVVKQYPHDLRGWGAMNSFYARRLTDRARKLEKEKRYYEAANLYRDIVTRDASVASAWWGLGSLFFKYHKKQQAIYCMDKVLKLKPGLKTLRHWLEQYKGS